uniref:Uncharacterized protein n=1 Tax=Anguilla anguilla TaxID=7936 RepID=A0A0E9RQ24_ANGAN
MVKITCRYAVFGERLHVLMSHSRVASPLRVGGSLGFAVHVPVTGALDPFQLPQQVLLQGQKLLGLLVSDGQGVVGVAEGEGGAVQR